MVYLIIKTLFLIYFYYRIPPTTGSLQTIDLTYMCGGTLLNRYTILTAAHCINTEFDWPVRGVTYTIKVTDPFDVKPIFSLSG